MDLNGLRTLLDEIATERLSTDWKLEEHKDSLVLIWETDGLEHHILTREADDSISVEMSVFYDDAQTNERLWTAEDIAEITQSYSSVISAAIQAAMTTAQNTEQSDLTVIDKLPKN